MKKKIHLSSGIFLKNKKFKKNKYYHFFSLFDYAIIMPVLKNNKFLVISQKRIPINQNNFEFPAGLVDKNETPVETAKRELFEETGYKNTKSLKKIVEFYPDPGRISNKATGFFAKNLKKISKPEKGIKLFFFSKSEIINLIKKKKFNNAHHIAVFYKYLYDNKK
ncbi:NUDIX hydrolase [Candidatus Pelagibacter sp.]|nr:NUDIX hydrolase [Candidatus Pelagibacter sp.]